MINTVVVCNLKSWFLTPESYSHLWCKIRNVGLLPLQCCMGHKAGKVAVLHAQLLDLSIKEILDGLPDGKGPGPQDVAAGHVVILHHLGFSQHLAGTNHYFPVYFIL
jgi:hypothetical protein